MDINDLEKKLGIEGMSADEQMAMVIALQKSAEEKSKQARDETIGNSEHEWNGWRENPVDSEFLIQHVHDAEIDDRAGCTDDAKLNELLNVCRSPT